MLLVSFNKVDLFLDNCIFCYFEVFYMGYVFVWVMIVDKCIKYMWVLMKNVCKEIFFVKKLFFILFI